MTAPGHDALCEQLTALHEECWGWALACCRGERDSAEEVLHMSYHKILDQRARYNGQSSFKTWLFGVIRLTALDHRRWSVRHWLRFGRIEDAVEPEDERDGAAETVDRRGRCAEVRAALQRLAARQAEVLHLLFYHDLTLDAAASVMGISAGSARQHYERGKSNLRRLLGENPNHP